MKDQSRYKISLRSIGEEDTTVISKSFGGGGHKNASGFTIDRNIFESWKV
jgi:nanoRNase/pAp phosphatase (c-di-AMP/oligoRNAs hydrolase)